MAFFLSPGTSANEPCWNLTSPLLISNVQIFPSICSRAIFPSGFFESQISLYWSMTAIITAPFINSPEVFEALLVAEGEAAVVVGSTLGALTELLASTLGASTFFAGAGLDSGLAF